MQLFYFLLIPIYVLYHDDAALRLFVEVVWASLAAVYLLISMLSITARVPIVLPSIHKQALIAAAIFSILIIYGNYPLAAILAIGFFAFTQIVKINPTI